MAHEIGKAASADTFHEKVAPYRDHLYTLILGWIAEAGSEGMTSKEVRARLEKVRPRRDGRQWSLNDFNGRITDMQDAFVVRARGVKDRRERATVWVLAESQMDLLLEVA